MHFCIQQIENDFLFFISSLEKQTQKYQPLMQLINDISTALRTYVCIMNKAVCTVPLRGNVALTYSQLTHSLLEYSICQTRLLSSGITCKSLLTRRYSHKLELTREVTIHT